MRCPDCNKFVSYDEGTDPEINSEDLQINEDGISGVVTGEVRVVLPCAECGTELKEWNGEFEMEFEHECDGKNEIGEEEEKFEIEEVNASFSSRMEDKDRKGRQIKNHRYMKTYYGADITADIKCNKCGETITLEGHVEEQASGFDELV